MTARNLAPCLDFVFEREGGYVDSPHDPGGATNMGITLETLAQWRGKSVTKDDIAELSRGEAADIYAARFWQPVRGDKLPAGLDLVAFDAAVMSGPSRGVVFLQGALGVKPDGRVGPATLAAALSADGPTAIAKACANRISWLRHLGTWRFYGKGWEKRVRMVEARATRMSIEATGADPMPVLEANARPATSLHPAAPATAGAASAGAVAIGNPTTPGLVVAGAALVITLGLAFVAWRRRRSHDVRARAFMAEALAVTRLNHQQLSEETAA